MGLLATVVDGILAAVSQRAFRTETQIREFVRDDIERKVETLYGQIDKAKSAIRLNDLRAMRIFATDQQQTWIVADSRMAYCVLDDRRREEPRIQWRTKLENVVPVKAGESWPTATGVVHFGNRPKEWLYSKELFSDEPADVTINRFLSGNKSPETGES
jgi:hypothetical protein